MAKQRTIGPHLVKRGRVWQFHDGDGGRESLRTKDEAEARRRFALKLAEPRAARVPRASEHTLTQLRDAYVEAPHGWTERNAYTQRTRCNAFVKAMRARGAVVPSEVTRSVLDAWRSARMAKVSRATVNRGEQAARSMMRWALRARLTTCDVFAGRAKLREPTRTQRRTLPDASAVLAAARWLEEHDRGGAALCLRVGLATGLRLDELRHLRPSSLESDAVRVEPERGAASDAWTTKSYRERRIPVERAVIAHARALCAWRDHGACARGKRPAMGAGWLADEIDRATKALYPTEPERAAHRFRPHDLRRLFVTLAVRAGIAPDVVQLWVGHADLATTQRYLVTLASDARLVAPMPAGL